ncbi:peptidoglycan bridge formation glycyltransferase FemA/FemB family protein [Arthrobacter sp. I2-34]|uniref:Peptidoglycan bridge formation glycyltransferase FemA/FemB family protein n=1 Tax=Arthrobacter hankyongi TaxID=2904801 RepID=A0ABS9L1U9_9MICC|nr:peptidoglycan bridge formation glycyltransferase FemA/FemB family protein [Arthrobacter hankyongi]MCG2620601.1 peptidoglycan bridge formation glycyltransferase FemA/FemB family protein [Arthrobacter hankyongi]
MSASILQSAPWAEFQRRLGKQVFERSGEGWNFLAIREKTPLGSFLYTPYGPVAQNPAAFARALEALRSLAKAEGTHYVRVEPVAAGLGDNAAAVLTGHRLRRAPADVQPHLTWMLDLTQPEEKILAGMRSTSRNLYRNIHKKGVTFDVSTDPADIGILLGFLHDVSERAEFKAQSDDYLAQAARTLMPAGAAKLFIARLDGDPIAAALSYDTPTTRVYAHAAADDRYRKLNAGIPLLVTMMLDAKESGQELFDMWGVSPEDEPDHPWAGFSRFKRSFGGFEVEYPGTWDLPVNTVMHAAYTAARGLRNGLRRAAPAARKAKDAVVPALETLKGKLRR